MRTLVIRNWKTRNTPLSARRRKKKLFSSPSLLFSSLLFSKYILIFRTTRTADELRGPVAGPTIRNDRLREKIGFSRQGRQRLSSDRSSSTNASRESAAPKGRGAGGGLQTRTRQNKIASSLLLLPYLQQDSKKNINLHFRARQRRRPQLTSLEASASSPPASASG